MTDHDPLEGLPVADYVKAIAPYVAGRPISEVAREFNLEESQIVKLASNENPLGLPSSAARAIAMAASDLGRYPDPNGFDLKNALSRRFGVGQDWITLGNGSNDILELCARAFLRPGASAVYSQYAFVVYPLATQAAGATGIEVAATPDMGHDLQAMKEAIGDGTQLVFVANPNNPTGSFVPPHDMESFIAGIPNNVVIVLDEAYNEYLKPADRADTVSWARQYPNLIISRTFSKAFGLAGLRVGYAIAQPALTDVLNRVRQPFNVSTVAQAAAVAALADQAFLDETYQVNAQGMAQFQAAFQRLGLRCLPSHGNFVLVKVGDDPDAGRRINLAMLKQGVIVRPVANYGLPQWLRISIGLRDENERCIAALANALQPA